MHQVGCVVGFNQVAPIHHQIAGARIHRREDVGVLQLHASGLDRSLVGFHHRGIRLGLRADLIRLLARDNALFLESAVALRLQPRVHRLRLIALLLANGFVQVRLERTLIQPDQQLALANVFAFLEQDLLNLTIDL